MSESCMALSIRQPYVWAILYAGMPLVNRTWFSPHRGRLILHASRTGRRRPGGDAMKEYVIK